MSAESPADASSSDPNGSAESVHHDPVADSDLDPRSPAPARPGPLESVVNVLRRALIGLAELVPGISGRTVALVFCVYPRLLDTGAHAVDRLRSASLGPALSV